MHPNCTSPNCRICAERRGRRPLPPAPHRPRSTGADATPAAGQTATPAAGSPPGTAAGVDVSGLTPMANLIVEVLIARARLGEAWWSFDRECQRQVDQLADAGIVTWKASPAPGALLVGFTPPAAQHLLARTYRPPNGHRNPGDVLRAAAHLLETDEGTDGHSSVPAPEFLRHLADHPDALLDTLATGNS